MTQDATENCTDATNLQTRGPSVQNAPMTGDPDRTVEALVDLGVIEERARKLVESDRALFALVEELLEEGRHFTPEEVAAEAEVPLEVLQSWEQALGLPSPQHYRDIDVEHAKNLRHLLEVFSTADPERLLRSIRADAQALRRMAMGDLQGVYEQVVAPLRERGGDDVDVAVALAKVARALLPVAGPLIGMAYRRVLEHMLTTELVAEAARGAADTIPAAVGFVDVVGYTSLSARIDPSGLEEVLEAFETRCYAVAGTQDDVELVKFLGDAVMLVSVDPVPLAHALVTLVEPAEADGPLAGAPMRGGMAAGDVLVRLGDYYGPTVNLAARLTDRARTGRVLAAEDLGPALEDHFPLRRVPVLYLRGVGRHRPWSLRPGR
jgi:adenylate cyclase